MGYCSNIFFFSLSHNTTNCIVTGKAGRQRAGVRRGAPRHGAAGHDTARRSVIRPGPRAGWKQGRYTKICIVADGAPLGHDTRTLRCDIAQQCSHDTT